MVSKALPAYADVIYKAPDALLLVDEEGTINYANRRAAEQFGTAAEAIAGRPVTSLLLGGNPPVAGRRADGSEFPVDVRLAPVLSASGRWTLVVVRDATERHALLQDLRAARQSANQVAQIKGEFLAMAAHDLSQPVHTLDILVASLQRRAVTGSQLEEIAEQAAASVARMRELVRLLMEISRLEAGVSPVLAEPVRLEEVYLDLERQFAPAAAAKNLTLLVVPGDCTIETDPALLRGLLANLVSNAIRYTLKGEVRLRAELSADGSLLLTVADTGIGIPADQHQRIFDDFERLQDARNVTQEGFGLGLGIVRRLAVLLGLSVRVRSASREGSDFAVLIPAHRVSAPQEA